MEARATVKYIRVGPRKVRRIVKHLIGETAEDALIILKFLPHHSAKFVAKLLKSALANAEQKKNPDPESMTVKSILVNEGPTMKRLRPRAMGRANIIKKRTSHITLLLSDDS
jgi:large subunit ribosomal protein L22